MANVLEETNANGVLEQLDKTRAWHVSRHRSEAPMSIFTPDPIFSAPLNPAFSFAFRGTPSYGFGNVLCCVNCSAPLVISLTFDKSGGHMPLVTRKVHANARRPDGTAFGWDLHVDDDAMCVGDRQYSCRDCGQK
jgi:hypothetical protein